MLRKMTDKQRRRLRRKFHIRKRIYGTAARPRMTVYKSGRHLYAQVVDDDKGHTLAAISTLEKEFIALKPNVEGAAKLGEAMGQRLKDKNITTIVFDRNGYLYHGVVKALADATRKAGIVF
ncbi:MAG: 50S ribosomal protein L18 [Treponema sp.]|nr:50S ribosomal protein L18 [Treponema sp.]